MTTPVGTISLSDVNAELNLSPTALITMNDAAVRTLAGVGGSGTVISMNDLRGKSNRVAISLTISASTTNYDVYANRGPTYNAGTSDLTVTINPGVTVYSSSTGTAAFSIPSAFNPGDTVTVINNGVIVGRGGNGGNGGGGGPGPSGASGGPGLSVQRPVTIQNFNRVAGGGGGGGGGAAGLTQFPDQPSQTTGGGGGGGGVANGTGGSGGAGSRPPPGTPGQTAPLTAGGSGGAGSPTGVPSFNGGPGGAGGGYGASGSSGSPTNVFSGGGGGSTGAAITGNPFITWNPTGTRNGPIS